MKAAVLKDWFDLELTDIPVPTPGPDEALIKVRYGGVCGSDMVVYRHKHMTATIPRVLCHEILGTIESLPEGYDGPFKLGQRVLMNPVVSCGKCSACKRGLGHVCENLELLGIHRDGGFAEYTKVGVDKLVAIRSQLQKGDTVFISGGAAVGLYIAIFAKAYGAGRVIVSEVNEPRRQFVESMGIETINPMQTDPMDLMREVTGGGGFDMVYDTSGAKSATLQMPDLTRCGGKMMSLNLSGDAYEFIIGKVSFKEITLIGNRLYTQEDFEGGVRFVEENWRKLHLDRMVSDILPLSDIDKAINMMINGDNLCKIIIDCQKV